MGRRDTYKEQVGRVMQQRWSVAVEVQRRHPAGRRARRTSVIEKAVLCVTLLLMVLYLSLPAEAFWGDAPAEPPPEIFGVRLGDDIRNYPDMIKMRSANEFFPVDVYRRENGDDLKFSRWELIKDSEDWDKGTRYWAYEHKIYRISFQLNTKIHDMHAYEGVLGSLEEIFGPVQRSPWGGGEMIMAYEVLVYGDSYGGSTYISWLPVEKMIPLEIGTRSVNMNAPLVFQGIALGGKVEDFPSLELVQHKGPDIAYYVSKDSLPDAPESCVFSAYKGVIYEFVLFFEESYRPRRSLRYLALELFGLKDPWGQYASFWGDVQVLPVAPDTVYARLMPLCWEADRAKRAYERSTGP